MLTPRTRRTFPMIEPVREALTTSARPLDRAKIAMISSVALPKVALRRPPTPGPACLPSSSVASPRNQASGTIAIPAAANTIAAGRTGLWAAGKAGPVLCGTGNNGGDGLVAARHLAKDARITVLLARSPDQFDTKEAQTNFERLRDAQILAGLDRSEEAIAEADLIIDALLGIGAGGSLREPFASLVRQVNASGKPVISVDVPSGFGTDLMVRPTVTVALHDAKEGMTPENSGRIRIVDIGIPPKVVTMIGPGEFLLYPIPKATSHKGE